MPKRSAPKKAKSSLRVKSNPLSQALIAATAVLILLGAYEYVTQNDFTHLAPTQLFVIGAVLGVLGLYLKDEKL